MEEEARRSESESEGPIKCGILISSPLLADFSPMHRTASWVAFFLKNRVWSSYTAFMVFRSRKSCPILKLSVAKWAFFVHTCTSCNSRSCMLHINLDETPHRDSVSFKLTWPSNYAPAISYIHRWSPVIRYLRNELHQPRGHPYIFAFPIIGHSRVGA